MAPADGRSIAEMDYRYWPRPPAGLRHRLVLVGAGRGEVGDRLVPPPLVLEDLAHEQAGHARKVVADALRIEARGSDWVARIGYGRFAAFLAETDDDPVANVRGDAAVVSVVRCAHPRERVIVTVLVAVELLPIPIRIAGQWVFQVSRSLRLEKAQRQDLSGGNTRPDQSAPLDEVAS